MRKHFLQDTVDFGFQVNRVIVRNTVALKVSRFRNLSLSSYLLKRSDLFPQISMSTAEAVC